jgi:hypothetical protein
MSEVRRLMKKREDEDRETRQGALIGDIICLVKAFVYKVTSMPERKVL